MVGVGHGGEAGYADWPTGRQIYTSVRRSWVGSHMTLAGDVRCKQLGCVKTFLPMKCYNAMYLDWSILGPTNAAFSLRMISPEDKFLAATMNLEREKIDNHRCN